MLKVDQKIFHEILKQFSKSQDSVNGDVSVLQKWMSEQPHLPKTLDTRSLQNFLLLNKFSIEKSKRNVDAYYTVRTRLDDIYGGINPKLPHMRELREILYIVPHPQLFDNNRVIFLKMRDENSGEKLDPYNILRSIINIYEMRLRQDVMSGDIYIVDCAKVPLSYFLKLTPTIMVKAVTEIYQKVYSSRLIACYLVNFPSFGETPLLILKKFMKAKLFERIRVFPDFGVLQEKFSVDFLPEEFGGKGVSLKNLQEMWEQELLEHREFFDHLDMLKVDESLRPEELKNDDILGFYGNFKKLDVD